MDVDAISQIVRRMLWVYTVTCLVILPIAAVFSWQSEGTVLTIPFGYMTVSLMIPFLIFLWIDRLLAQDIKRQQGGHKG